MTADNYLGRKVASEEAAEVLEAVGDFARRAHEDRDSI
jgi:hypothetical protein